jgi:diaminohydroxyphosphoribosylaminopyrimidine deaminase/5-amino-6-(5-phosphoribosylamino)uracil reductase
MAIEYSRSVYSIVMKQQRLQILSCRKGKVFMQQERYMRRAMELAELGRGWTKTNPVVGAVLVKEDRIIGEGYHKKFGGLHAEREALADCRSRGEDPAGADLYVTLEPCCHYGKTPPCTQAVIEAGISHVFVGAEDINPLVAGAGIRQLREQGILVTEGVLQEECEYQNRVFFHYIQTKLPYVRMKYAMTLDGKIASASGKSQWITGEAAREQVHRMRHEMTGIMVGAGTVIADDPMLNCRLPQTKDPVRIVCDTTLRIPLKSRIVQTAEEQNTIIATCCQDEAKIREYQKYGCRIIVTEHADGKVDLKELMRQLGADGIESVLLEGGAMLNWSALEAGIVNEVYAYVAPKLFGGADAKSPVAGIGVDYPDDAYCLVSQRVQQVGEDILIAGELKNK